MLKADFRNFNELKKVFVSASLIGDDRVVFNILGNKYRLLVRMVFEFKTIQVKWFGTYGAYDKTDMKTVGYNKK